MQARKQAEAGKLERASLRARASCNRDAGLRLRRRAEAGAEMVKVSVVDKRRKQAASERQKRAYDEAEVEVEEGEGAEAGEDATTRRGALTSMTRRALKKTLTTTNGTRFAIAASVRVREPNKFARTGHSAATAAAKTAPARQK